MRYCSRAALQHHDHADYGRRKGRQALYVLKHKRLERALCIWQLPTVLAFPTSAVRFSRERRSSEMESCAIKRIVKRFLLGLDAVKSETCTFAVFSCENRLNQRFATGPDDSPTLFARNPPYSAASGISR